MTGRRYVLLTGGSFGDVIPYLALGRELRERGADVLFGASPSYRVLARGERLPFAPIGPELPYDVDQPFSTGTENRIRSFLRVTEEWLIRPLQRIADDIDATVREGDVIVAHPIQVAAPLVAARRGLPWITVTPTAWMIPAAERLPLGYPVASLGRPLNRLAWRWFGRTLDRRYRDALDEVAGGSGHRSFLSLTSSPGQTIVLNSPHLVAPRRLPSHVTAAGIVRWDTIRMWSGAEPLRRFLDEGSPPVAFRAPPHLPSDVTREMVAEVCADLGVRGVVIDLRASETGADGPIYTDRYIPLSVLAPRSLAGVHHGGLGTSVAFAAAGAPAVITPSIVDQFENAQTLAALGVAVQLDWRRVTTVRLKRALERCLRARPAAARLGARLRDEDGIATAAELILEAEAT